MKIYDIPNFNPLLYDAIKHSPPPPPLKKKIKKKKKKTKTKTVIA